MIEVMKRDWEKQCYSGSETGPDASDRYGQRGKQLRRLDQAGLRYVELKESDEDGARKAVLMTIFELAYGLFPKYEQSIGTFYAERLNRFDPHRGNSFSKYMSQQLEYLERDRLATENELKKETYVDDCGNKRRRNVSVVADLQRGETDRDADKWFLEDLGDPSCVSPLQDLEDDSVELFCKLLSSIQALPERLQGKANNPARQNYFRMFYTADMTALMRNESDRLSVYARHERDLFQAMKLPFLDFYMQDACRTVFQIAADPLKSYGELVEGRPNQETPCPLPGDVYLSFLRRWESQSISAPALSQQRNAYKQYMREVVSGFLNP